jgi:hypothetical protein
LYKLVDYHIFVIAKQQTMTNIQEIWKPIKNYEGLYEVSNLGRVKSLARVTLKRHSISKQIMNYPQKELIMVGSISAGYPSVLLSKNNIPVNNLIHRLVATHFIHNPEDKEQVNHKNGNKKDNRVENLEWNTRSENQKHSYAVLGTKSNKSNLGRFGEDSYSSKSVIKYSLNLERIERYGSMKEAAKQNNIGVTSISLCASNKQKTAGGFIWIYE